MKHWSSIFDRSANAPMNCADVAKWLQRYLDGHLDERRVVRIEAHLDDCRRCGLEADTYIRIKQSLASDRTAIPSDALDRLRHFADRVAQGDVPQSQ
jgi:anti-sigma factor RsiW